MDAPWYVSNRVLRTDLKVPTFLEEMAKFNVRYYRPPRAQRGSRGIDLLILNLGARRGWVVSFTYLLTYSMQQSPS
jgi:hypothetical protein